ncbi:hypothetical protein [Microcoleus sp. CAWBG58]|uniref:hypothetical protein n=1 Tax=Microcoleus sp. CAWBG58 TaxID=2841651 RepID=UPI0025EBD984|nr:hypothetical protein [Microcoleus sp. CAWBG58]
MSKNNLLLHRPPLTLRHLKLSFWFGADLFTRAHSRTTLTWVQVERGTPAGLVEARAGDRMDGNRLRPAEKAQKTSTKKSSWQ